MYVSIYRYAYSNVYIFNNMCSAVCRFLFWQNGAKPCCVRRGDGVVRLYIYTYIYIYIYIYICMYVSIYMHI